MARRAGVSRATVSYVLNGRSPHPVSERTARAVRRAAAALDYRPNPFALSLKRGRGGTVLFPLPGGAMNLVLAEAIDACASALGEHGLTLVTDSTRYDSPAGQGDSWMRLHPAAVIDIFVTADEPALAPLRSAGVAVLTSTTSGDESAAETIVLEARRTQLNYILERDHRSVLVTGQPPAERRAEQRLRRHAAHAAKTADASVAVRRQPLTREGVDTVVEEWLASPTDAICASSDDFAIALLQALHGRGVRVPEDVAVIGVDDVPLAAASTPSLTTVAADLAPWGAAVAELVHAAIEGGASDAALPSLRTHVVVRESA